MCDKIRPQPGFLKMPPKGTLIYKIISPKYFIDEFENNYLYFRRVDKYSDFRDSDLPSKCRKKAEGLKYEKDPDFDEAKRCDRQRSRTYACCFSTENIPYIWSEYADNDQNSICVVFDCYRLVEYLEETINDSILLYEEKKYPVGIFSSCIMVLSLT